MNEITEWSALARALDRAGIEIFATSQVEVTEKGYADEKYVAMILLARTLSNLRSALLLLDHRRVIEARILTRCCLENGYWVGGLVNEGEAFVRQMRTDESAHRKMRGERLFASGAAITDEVADRLREHLRGLAKRFPTTKTLDPKGVAAKTDIGRTYIFYEQLSSDSGHPSLDALHRHVVPHSETETGGIDVDPPPREEEIAETFEYLCMAVMGVCVGVNELLGGTKGGEALAELADRYTDLSNRRSPRET